MTEIVILSAKQIVAPAQAKMSERLCSKARNSDVNAKTKLIVVGGV